MTKKDKRRERTEKKWTGRQNKTIVRNINKITEKQKQFGEVETVLRKRKKIRERERKRGKRTEKQGKQDRQNQK